jgi:hypothetical protein
MCIPLPLFTAHNRCFPPPVVSYNAPLQNGPLLGLTQEFHFHDLYATLPSSISTHYCWPYSFMKFSMSRSWLQCSSVGFSLGFGFQLIIAFRWAGLGVFDVLMRLLDFDIRDNAELLFVKWTQRGRYSDCKCKTALSVPHKSLWKWGTAPMNGTTDLQHEFGQQYVTACPEGSNFMAFSDSCTIVCKNKFYPPSRWHHKVTTVTRWQHSILCYQGDTSSLCY